MTTFYPLRYLPIFAACLFIGLAAIHFDWHPLVATICLGLASCLALKRENYIIDLEQRLNDASRPA